MSTTVTTIIKQMLHKSQAEATLMAKLVEVKQEGCTWYFIQLGRFTDNYSASEQQLIACNRDEVGWLLSKAKVVEKNSKHHLVTENAVVLFEQTFDDDRKLSIGISSSKRTKSAKMITLIEFTQRSVDEGSYNECKVIVPLNLLKKTHVVLKHLMFALDLCDNVEQNIVSADHIFTSYLTYLVAQMMPRALNDPQFVVVPDEAMLVRIKSATAPMNYWFVAKHIAANFKTDHAQKLLDIFKVLKIEFHHEKMEEDHLQMIFDEQVSLLMKPSAKYLFDFTEFMLVNVSSF